METTKSIPKLRALYKSSKSYIFGITDSDSREYFNNTMQEIIVTIEKSESDTEVESLDTPGYFVNVKKITSSVVGSREGVDIHNELISNFSFNSNGDIITTLGRDSTIYLDIAINDKNFNRNDFI